MYIIGKAVLVNSRLLMVKFWGEVKSYVWIFGSMGVSAPDPRVIQRSTVYNIRKLG